MYCKTIQHQRVHILFHERTLSSTLSEYKSFDTCRFHLLQNASTQMSACFEQMILSSWIRCTVQLWSLRLHLPHNTPAHMWAWYYTCSLLSTTNATCCTSHVFMCCKPFNTLFMPCIMRGAPRCSHVTWRSAPTIPSRTTQSETVSTSSWSKYRQSQHAITHLCHHARLYVPTRMQARWCNHSAQNWWTTRTSQSSSFELKKMRSASAE